MVVCSEREGLETDGTTFPAVKGLVQVYQGRLGMQHDNTTSALVHVPFF